MDAAKDSVFELARLVTLERIRSSMGQHSRLPHALIDSSLTSNAARNIARKLSSYAVTLSETEQNRLEQVKLLACSNG